MSDPVQRSDPGEALALEDTQAAPHSLSGSSASSLADDEADAVGLAVPGYKLLRRLGHGAYGTVFLALQEKSGKQVAIKFYSHQSAVDWNLLQTEVEKLAAVYTERNIVQLIEVGWDARPPYYVMEYLSQGSLADLLARGTLPPNQAVRLVKDVARALVAAHGRGILHCDLKPANVLLDHDLRPRLCDFGQSRMTSEQSPALGTFFYMAPEQADLSAIPDARWDVYALGAMLFALITGRPPYRNKDSQRLLEDAPTLPVRLERYRRLLQTAPLLQGPLERRRVDPALRQIILRCLNFVPAERYPNAQAVLDALLSREARRRRRPLLMLGALGPTLLLLVMTLSGWKVVRTAVETSRDALTRRAVESNSFAARFVAESAAHEIERRFSALEEAAVDPELRQLLRDVSSDAASEIKTADYIPRFQRWLEHARKDHAEIVAMSYFVNDATGMQWGRTPSSDTIGRSWAYRDYFHGRGHDYPSDKVPDDIRPIQGPYLSAVFESKATGNRVVAFSVPVFSELREAAPKKVQGVLGMTVEMGRFGELHPGSGADTRQIAVLLDLREDWKAQRGLILQHPRLHELLKHPPLPDFRLSRAKVQRLDQVFSSSEQDLAPLPLFVDSRYEDPIGNAPGGERYGGRWVAAMGQVRSRGRPTGWVVVVQEREADLVLPIVQLSATLTRIGGWGLVFAIALLFSLWGFVIFDQYTIRQEQAAPPKPESRNPALDASMGV